MIVYNAKRESGFIPEIGRFADMQWVVRDNKGNYLDRDRYQNDLSERFAMQEIAINFIEEDV